MLSNVPGPNAGVLNKYSIIEPYLQSHWGVLGRRSSATEMLQPLTGDSKRAFLLSLILGPQEKSYMRGPPQSYTQVTLLLLILRLNHIKFSRTHPVAKPGLKLVIPLLQSPKHLGLQACVTISDRWLLLNEGIQLGLELFLFAMKQRAREPSMFPLQDVEESHILWTRVKKKKSA